MTSVVTPCFNAARTIRRAHESLLIQGCNWEHIIVDDASTDDSWNVIQSLKAKSYRSPLNQGAGASLNAGLELVEGDFIAFLDADDEYLPGHLTSHLEVMAANPDVDILWGGMEVVGASEDLLVPDAAKGEGLIPIRDCVVQGTIFARRHVFAEMRFIEKWYQDYDFIQRARRRFVVGRFTKPTYRYYRDTGTSTVDKVKAEWA
jgi:glycosyltransferase involved in cell wall biosynthesis